MDYEKRFNAIKTFLNKHQFLHELELLERFPGKLTAPYHHWLSDLKQLEFHDLIAIESCHETKKLKNQDLIDFINQCKELSDIPSLSLIETPLPNHIKRKMSLKKTHEVQSLKSYVDQLKGIDTIIDIGSGVGHLSSALVYNKDLKSYCLDLNTDFQEQGKKKIKQWVPEVKEKITFIRCEVNKNTDYPFQYDKNKTLTIGLHACGPLTTYIIQQRPKHLLSFSCCYHKLNDEYNISKIAQADPIALTNHALTLAAKCLGTNRADDLDRKLAVKRFRYALHFYLIENDISSFTTLGNASAQDYQGRFESYAKKFFPKLKDKTDLQQFFDKDSTQEKIQYYFRAGTIRSLLGRLVEVYLILDRVLYLRDHQLEANCFEVFDRKLSPRNIGILV